VPQDFDPSFANGFGEVCYASSIRREALTDLIAQCDMLLWTEEEACVEVRADTFF
jgi:4-hydroxy-3-methylbut-2-enyl diphosphate reductase IspH